jgi:hypothetical protein
MKAVPEESGNKTSFTSLTSEAVLLLMHYTFLILITPIIRLMSGIKARFNIAGKKLWVGHVHV